MQLCMPKSQGDPHISLFPSILPHTCPHLGKTTALCSGSSSWPMDFAVDTKPVHKSKESESSEGFLSCAPSRSSQVLCCLWCRVWKELFCTSCPVSWLFAVGAKVCTSSFMIWGGKPSDPGHTYRCSRYIPVPARPHESWNTVWFVCFMVVLSS